MNDSEINPLHHPDSYIPADQFVFREGTEKETDENFMKKEWYKNLLYSLSEIASKNFQNRIWIKGKGPEVSDYSEAACIFFDDLSMTEVYKMHQHGYLTKNELEIIMPFHKIYDNYLENDNNEPFTIDTLNSIEWTEVTKIAKETLEKLKENNRK